MTFDQRMRVEAAIKDFETLKKEFEHLLESYLGDYPDIDAVMSDVTIAATDLASISVVLAALKAV